MKTFITIYDSHKPNSEGQALVAQILSSGRKPSEEIEYSILLLYRPLEIRRLVEYNDYVLLEEPERVRVFNKA